MDRGNVRRIDNNQLDTIDAKKCQPFKPWYKNAYSPYCSPHISYGTS